MRRQWCSHSRDRYYCGMLCETCPRGRQKCQQRTVCRFLSWVALLCCCSSTVSAAGASALQALETFVAKESQDVALVRRERRLQSQYSAGPPSPSPPPPPSPRPGFVCNGCLAVGTSSSPWGCAVNSAGGMTCWSNQPPQPVSPGMPYATGPVLALATAGQTDTVCAIVAPLRQLQCTGGVWKGVYGLPSPAPTNVAQASMGLYHVGVVFTNGTTGCWGDAQRGQCSIPSQFSTGVKQIAAGAESTCAVRTDGACGCWGCNQADADYGQCSVPVTFSSGMVAVACGVYHACGLKAGGSVTCWGYDGQLQVSGQPSTLPPVAALVLGAWHSCVILLFSGGLVCWGDAAQVPPAWGSGVVGAAAGYDSICAVKGTGEMNCWTWFNFGDTSWDTTVMNVPFSFRNLWAAPGPSSPSPLPSPSPRPDFLCDGCLALASDAQGGVVCARRPNGMTVCNPPIQLPAEYGIGKLVSGVSSTLLCAILNDYQFVCSSFGKYDAGLVLQNVMSAAVGANHTCVVFGGANSTAWCFGTNDARQLDIGGRNKPQKDGVVQVAAGHNFTCLLSSKGVPSCVGDNSTGQLQVPLNFRRNITQVSAGYMHACALNASGGVGCWGDNRMNQSRVPANLGPVSYVSAGGDHTCALLSTSRRAACWGPASMVLPPPQFQGKLSFIRAGFSSTCAVTVAGQASCWDTLSWNSAVTLPPKFQDLSTPFSNTSKTACQVPFCAACSPTSPDICGQCIAGYYKTSRNQCGACSDNCYTCDSASQCNSCLPGYWLNCTAPNNRFCADCGIRGCDQCAWVQNTTFTCTSCVKGFQLQGGVCGLRPLGCGPDTFPATCAASGSGSRCDDSNWILQGARSLCVTGQQCLLMYKACLLESPSCQDCCLRIDSSDGATWYLLRFDDSLVQCDPTNGRGSGRG